MVNPPLDDIFQQYESQYVTDLEGRLIRIEAATRDDMQKRMTVTIDGQEVKGVPKAVPATDDQGNIIRDEDGMIVPRLSTVYDAVTWRYRNDAQANFTYSPDRKNPVPVLCHQNHLRPMGVCRVCSCLTVKKGTVGEKMIPSCQHPLVDGMEVHTVASTVPVKAPGLKDPTPAGGYLKQTVKVILELLAANSLHEEQPVDDRRYRNELLDLARAFDVPVKPVGDRKVEIGTAFRRRPYDEARTDDSSAVIHVNHNNCILCDRCVRGCSEVKPFKVIGHTGFGNKAKVSFDLNAPMGESSCVTCGECTISCPTGALTFKTSIYQNRDPWHDEPLKPKTIKAEKLEKHALFAGVPYSFLKWNEGAVGVTQARPGEILCKQGDYGSTAFLIEDGGVDVVVGDKAVATMTRDDYIAGERAVMAHQPRSATLRAGAGGATLWIVKRNMLHMLQRNRSARAVLHPIYRRRALDNYLRRGSLFSGLSPEQNAFCSQFLSGRDDVELIQVDPGQAVFLQGNEADSFYVIALGHVTVQETRPSGHTLTLNYLGRGRSFGEVGLLSRLSEDVGKRSAPGMRGRRTFSCVALDHVELVSIPAPAFEALLKAGELLVQRADLMAQVCGEEDVTRAVLMATTKGIDGGTAAAAWKAAKAKEVGRDGIKRLMTGPTVGERLIAKAIETLEQGQQRRGDVSLHQMGEFTKTGLYQGQNLLVLDLNRCTRCQECVKACSDSHGGVTRLILEGNRFDKYLVPSACRSCHDPACLTGCPVDAIHRRPAAGKEGKSKSLAIFIEDHCIGCSLCAHNCPYGSIHMLELAPGQKRASTERRKATNCDLCESLDGNPRCVKHCPHEAAQRMEGVVLAERVGLHPAGVAGAEPNVSGGKNK